MRNILITGAESYIGQQFREYIDHDKEIYSVTELDVRDDEWKNFDFSKFDVIYHVAAIVHRNEKEVEESLYYRVNRDLTYSIAKKAKESGVKQFVFMSTMSVYGLITSKEDIGLNTICSPVTKYGKSKLEAEKLLDELNDDKFKVCIVRPPMVCGMSAPGNMGKLISVVKKLRVFPEYHNERSYITINTLVAFIKELIDKNKDGVFLPQESEYLCTSDFIKEYMKNSGIKVHYTKKFNPIISMFVGRMNLIAKCFGDLKYEK